MKWIRWHAEHYRADFCLVYPYYRLPNGYGMFTEAGKTQYAHRVKYEDIMTDLSPAHELIADLDRQIAEEETKVRERIDRLRHYAGPDEEDEVWEAWYRFNMAVEPMRRQRDYVVKQLATIEAMKIPGPIVIMNPSAVRTP
jgi:hypothetical protein